MITASEWMSGFVGAMIFCAGLFPLLNKMGKGPEWWDFQLPVALLAWIAMIGGFYLVINSVVELTNNNIMGWISGLLAVLITVTGVLSVLGKAGKVTGFFAMEWIPATVYSVIFILLGLFLMISTIAMKV